MVDTDALACYIQRQLANNRQVTRILLRFVWVGIERHLTAVNEGTRLC